MFTLKNKIAGRWRSEVEIIYTILYCNGLLRPAEKEIWVSLTDKWFDTIQWPDSKGSTTAGQRSVPTAPMNKI